MQVLVPTFSHVKILAGFTKQSKVMTLTGLSANTHYASSVRQVLTCILGVHQRIIQTKIPSLVECLAGGKRV